MAFSMVQKSTAAAATVCALLFSQADAAPEHEAGISHKLRARLAEADKYQTVIPS